MKRWKTDEIEKLLSQFDCTIERLGPGGDVDSNTLHLVAKGAGEREFLHVAGFRTDWKEITDPDNVEVEMVEVTDGQDSQGGLNTDDEPTGILYLKVCKALRKAGFEVVRSMDDYF